MLIACRKQLLSILILWCFFINMKAQTILDQEIKLPIQSGSTDDLLQNIEDKTGIIFSYSNRVCIKSSIKLSSRYNSIYNFLNEIFLDCPVNYKIKNNKVLITPIEKKEVKNKGNFYQVSGFVTSAEDGEILIGASVYDLLKVTGTSTNPYGYYSFKVPKGEVIINASYVGFTTRQNRFDIHKDTLLNIQLSKASAIQEVPVISNIAPEGINTTRTGTISVPIEQIKEMPAILGEVDVIKSLVLLPGINSGGEGSGGLYVRGGGADQNLYLLDDVPIYNISHLLGFFSIFNAEAINNVNITKGGFPARYGGRLSSVIDVRMKDGSKEKINGLVSLGILSSQLSLNGPISKKTTFSISARRSYFDLYSSLIQQNLASKTSFFFYDINSKISHQLNAKNKLYFSFYTGQDKYFTKYNYRKLTTASQPDISSIKLNDETNSGWGNLMSALRWNKLFNDKLISNITLAYTRYKYFIGYLQNEVKTNSWNYYEQKYNSGIADAMLKIDFDYFLNNNHHVKFGGNYTYHIFNPKVDIIKKVENIETVIDSTIGGTNMYGKEIYLYAEDDFSISKRLKFNVGLHYAGYITPNKMYHSWQPRLSGRYLVHPKLAIKASYSRMTQFLHVVNSNSLLLTTDVWLPVTDEIKPQYSDLYAFSAKWQIQQGFNISIEAYYKDNRQLIMIDPENNAASWQTDIIYGKGDVKGIEFLIHKKYNKLSGWFGYTLSKSENIFPGVNNGKYFPTSYDRRHDVGIYTNYKINDNINIGATWAFSSGNAVTLPTQKYYKPTTPTQGSITSNNYSEYIDEINGYTMPVYHRLDIGLNMTKKIKWGERTWSLGIYNAYGRQNAFSLYFTSEYDDNGDLVKRQLNQLSLFPFPIPYLRYSIKF